jgi:hypothetical protein
MTLIVPQTPPTLKKTRHSPGGALSSHLI